MSKFKKISKEVPFYKNPRVLTITVGVLIMVIMITSVLTYSLFSSEKTEELEYKGLLFHKINNVWVVSVGGARYAFQYSPKEIEDQFGQIPFTYSTEKNYVAFDPSQLDEGSVEVASVATLLDNLQAPVVKACMKGSKNCKNLEKVNCKNKNKVFVVNMSSSDTITVSNNCLIFNMQGNQNKALNYLMYKIIGIM